MKLFFLLLLSSIASICGAQKKWYAAVKNGLTIREKPDAKSTVVGKIPYGTGVTISYPETIVSIATGGLTGAWAKTTYDGKTGYVVDVYLLPAAPPNATVKTMKEYLAQLSAIAGAPLIVKGNMYNIEEGSTETKKQLYKNGAEYHAVAGYEWQNDAYFLPGFTTKQGFILLRLIPEFKAVFAGSDMFPTKSSTLKKGEVEYDIKVEAQDIGKEKWVKRIAIEFAEGVVKTFEMFQLGNQLVISFGSGV